MVDVGVIDLPDEGVMQAVGPAYVDGKMVEVKYTTRDVEEILEVWGAHRDLILFVNTNTGRAVFNREPADDADVRIEFQMSYRSNWLVESA